MNKMRNFEDKRKFIRLKAYHLVKYKLFSEKAAKGAFVTASIKDIGAGGVCLRTKEYIAISNLLEMRINFPSVDTSVSALAKVVWAKEVIKNSQYEIGAQFIDLDDSLRVLIDRQVSRVYQRATPKKPQA
jgi:c-di-GMP-binding flagellar brake protein YcgR